MHQYPYEFKKLIDCWQSMPRPDDQAPRKTSFNPAKVSSLMPFLFLIERVEKGDLVVRLKGNELNETMGCRTRDRCMFDAMMRRDWAFYDRFVSSCAKNICAGRLLRTVRLKDGLYKDVESLHVPLSDGEGNARFMLGVMTTGTNRTASTMESYKSPKAAILNYQYVDLGCGVPLDGAISKPARKDIQNNIGADTEPLPTSGEYEPAYVS